MSENYWDKFIEELLDAVEKALDNGTPARLNVGGEHDITIDIYKTKTQMKVFDEAVLELAKTHRGMGVVK